MIYKQSSGISCEKILYFSIAFLYSIIFVIIQWNLGIILLESLAAWESTNYHNNLCWLLHHPSMLLWCFYVAMLQHGKCFHFHHNKSLVLVPFCTVLHSGIPFFQPEHTWLPESLHWACVFFDILLSPVLLETLLSLPCFYTPCSDSQCIANIFYSFTWFQPDYTLFISSP